MVSQNDLKEKFKNNFFLKNVDPNKFMFDIALSKSIDRIKELQIKLAWYYDEERLKWKSKLDWIKLTFLWEIFKNYCSQNRSNFFPLLTKLTIDLFSYFKIEKNEEYCINYIKTSLKKYFNINDNSEIENNNDIELEKTNIFFKKEFKKINQDKNSINNIIEDEDEDEDEEDFNTINETNILSSSIQNIYDIKQNNIWETLKKQFEYNYNFLGELFYNSKYNFNVQNEIEKNLSIKKKKLEI